MKEYLRECRPDLPAPGPKHVLTTLDMEGMIFQVACALRFLEFRHVIHRDLAARNVLVGEKPEGTVRVFRQKFTLEDAIGSHACSLEANTRVTNGIPLGSSLLLPVDTVNCVQTLKGSPRFVKSQTLECLGMCTKQTTTRRRRMIGCR
jgi:serine/threonine protein kinase